MGAKFRSGLDAYKRHTHNVPAFNPPPRAARMMSVSAGILSYHTRTCPQCGERHALSECPYWKPAA
jgi:hypothetical protein